jgi:hypothetical protein
MASEESVRVAVDALLASFDDVDEDTRRRIPDRSLSVWVLDVDLAFAGRFEGGHLVDVAEIDPSDRGRSNLKIELDSDALLEMTEGSLSFAHAWASGRVHVDARLRDLWELRKFL